MKKLYLILLTTLFLLNTVMAQELKVKSFVLALTDITAQTEGRKDLNGDACALVKINFVGDVLDVEGNVIKPLVRRNNETWAYMTQGARKMKVYTKDALPLMLTFGNYWIDKLQSNRTYVLTLVKSSGTAESRQMQTLTIKYYPVSASVLVDNKFIKGSNGVVKTSLPVGQHTFVVACDGYESEEGTVKLKPSAPSNLQITLSKDMSSNNDMAQKAPVATFQPSVISQSAVQKNSNILTIPIKDGVNIEMVKVEAGSFKMGATKEMKSSYLVEKPVHRVTLTKNYYLGKYEVTQAQWKIVMGTNPSNFNGEELPVEQVSWNDCKEFISKLNRLTGLNFRLPTEAEWEYAARGGVKSASFRFAGSNNHYDVGWFWGSSEDKTHKFGLKKTNELGIYDMTGNVYEWCEDWYGPYSNFSQVDPMGPSNGNRKVLRGGGWNTSPWRCHLSHRGCQAPEFRDNELGFRLALSE